MKTSIVIPIYKEIPSDFEIVSFKRCLVVFRNWDIYIVHPVDVDLIFYTEIAKNENVIIKSEPFSSAFFTNIESYNRLMMNLSFYKRFKTFDYMLIYQLDAYVFENRLSEWIDKGYDYIGAPWFDNYKSKEDGAELWAVGNGGLSLRKIQSFIAVLNSKKPVKSYNELKEDYNQIKFGIIKRMIIPILIILRSLGYKNKIDYWKRQCGDNEDYFWTLYLDELGLGLKRPSVIESVEFAFDQSPSYLYKLNKQRLPFGCHAWYKYEYESFWKRIIVHEE
jgi:hypothetical protein